MFIAVGLPRKVAKLVTGSDATVRFPPLPDVHADIKTGALAHNASLNSPAAWAEPIDWEICPVVITLAAENVALSNMVAVAYAIENSIIARTIVKNGKDNKANSIATVPLFCLIQFDKYLLI